MFKHFKIILLVVVLFFSYNGYSQVVNIESARLHTDTIRFASINEASMFYNDNNGLSLFNFKVSSTSQLKSKNLKNIILLTGNYNIIKSASAIYQNSWLVHMRYNYKLTRLFRLETFLQNQYNYIIDLNQRSFIGGGFRLKLLAKENISVYLGESYIYENEQNYDKDISRINHRNSTYLSFNIKLLKNKIEIINTCYYQPKYADFSDYNFLEQFKVNNKIGKKINIFGLLNYMIDTNTPLDRVQYTFDTTFGIGINI